MKRHLPSTVVLLLFMMSSALAGSSLAARGLLAMDMSNEVAAAYVPDNLKEILHALIGKHPENKTIALAAEAFLWAFPLVNTAPNFHHNGVKAPKDMNQIFWNYEVNNFTFNSIVTPNVNVLYGPGFFDLTKGPINITVPDTADRYYVLQCMDFWGLTFGRIGFTVTGTAAGTFTLVGPDYNGTLSSNMLQSTTFGVWIMGRIAVINQNQTDISIADGLVRQFKVSAPNPAARPANLIFKSTNQANNQWNRFDQDGVVAAFWHAYTLLVGLNQPYGQIAENGRQFEKLGVTMEGVKWSKLRPKQRVALTLGSEIGWFVLRNLTASMSGSTRNSTAVLTTWNGWGTSPQIGNPNNTIPIAALISYAYVAANIPAEAVYWSKYTDNTCNKTMTLGNDYIFELPSEPPYRGFWSLTTYNSTNFFLISTTNNIYTLGSQFPLVMNGQGGITLYLSNKPPADPLMLPNWLPLGDDTTDPKAEFYLIFRIYSPDNADVVYNYFPGNVTLTSNGGQC